MTLTLLRVTYLSILISNTFCDDPHEISLIKRNLAENRKKQWKAYYHKLLAQSLNNSHIEHLKIVRNIKKIQEKMNQCLAININMMEIYNTSNTASLW